MIIMKTNGLISLILIQTRCSHASVSMGNIFFIIGRLNITSFEVFKRLSKKFTMMKSEIKVPDFKC